MKRIVCVYRYMSNKVCYLLNTLIHIISLRQTCNTRAPISDEMTSLSWYSFVSEACEYFLSVLENETNMVADLLSKAKLNIEHLTHPPTPVIRLSDSLALFLWHDSIIVNMQTVLSCNLSNLMDRDYSLITCNMPHRLIFMHVCVVFSLQSP